MDNGPNVNEANNNNSSQKVKQELKKKQNHF